MSSEQELWLAGVDGCRAGWVVALVRPCGDDVRVRVVPGFADILSAPEAPAIVAVDMPIGLPEFSEVRGRACEREIRPLLGLRRSSVFRIPSRPAVNAGVNRSIPDDTERYKKACSIARQTSKDRKAFAKQGFYLFSKILEIDQLLRDEIKLCARVHETHPELAFWQLNGQCPLKEPKKRKGRLNEAGLEERRHLLLNADLSVPEFDRVSHGGAAPDDLLDALACAAIARRIHAGQAQSFPESPKRDAFGLPMAIWA